MQWHLHREVDEYWGPLDPRVLPELRAAHSAAGMAVYLEAADPGRGIALLNRLADEPPELCPPLKKPPKPPKGGGDPGPPEPPEPIEPALLGAALVALADSINNKELANVARERGAGLMG
jgi:hypothetical protein